ncbi:MAG: 50S ribosomal protein L18 [Bacteroidales bacterium]|nr:50S ribosomal protein L18 [Bacteroidales bacterium]
MALSNKDRRLRIKMRVRKDIGGTAERPRMSVFRSNKHIAVQIIDDVAGRTLISASSLNKEIASKKVKKTEQAVLVGDAIAKKAVEAGISEIVFDRNGFRYHGRVKALADSARKNGLKF